MEDEDVAAVAEDDIYYDAGESLEISILQRNIFSQQFHPFSSSISELLNIENEMSQILILWLLIDYSRNIKRKYFCINLPALAITMGLSANFALILK